MFFELYIIFCYIFLTLKPFSFCPDKCKCNIENTFVDCSSLLLSTEPNFDNSTEIINLTNNYLTSINKITFQHLISLKEIYFSSNLISLIKNGSFTKSNNLHTLDIKHNHLKKFECSIFAHDNKIASIDLAKNDIIKFYCDDYDFPSLNFISLSYNKLQEFPFHIFSNGFQELARFDLSYNNISSIIITNSMMNLNWLDLHNNKLHKFEISDYANFPNLKYLNLASNKLKNVNSNSFRHMPNLKSLNISDNPIMYIASGTFQFLNILNFLYMDHLLINSINKKTFIGLNSIKNLSINNNKLLSKIDTTTFSDSKSLVSLSISNNSVFFINAKNFYDLQQLRDINLSGNKFVCDCQFWQTVTYLYELKIDNNLNIEDIICHYPTALNGISAFSLKYLAYKCSLLTQSIGDIDDEVLFIDEMSAFMSSKVNISCTILDIIPSDNFLWFKRDRSQEVYRFSLNETDDKKFIVHENGILTIAEVNRTDLGYYYCRSLSNKSNFSSVTLLLMNVDFMSDIEIHSLFWALMSVIFFSSIAILIAFYHICGHLCSKKKRIKRKSMHDVLQAIRSSVQMNRLLSYRSAQIERISALRSATLDHLSSFKSARVDDIRRYKQATVNTVLHCLDRMRVHYTAQTVRIKDHCATQIDKLRARYIQQCSRLKNKKSNRFKKIRHRYNMQAMKIKDYSTQQVARLRDQYKQQQQHLMKLLELLEISNCVNIIETDCSQAESIIFDTHLDLSLSDSDDDANDHHHAAEASSLLNDDGDEEEEEEEDGMEMDFDLSIDELDLVDVELFKEEEWDNIATEISSMLVEEGGGTSICTPSELKQTLAKARLNFFLENEYDGRNSKNDYDSRYSNHNFSPNFMTDRDELKGCERYNLSKECKDSEDSTKFNRRNRKNKIGDNYSVEASIEQNNL